MSINPRKLGIFYGWPSVVNSSQSTSDAVNVFKAYDQVVLGAGLEESSHGDHANTVAIINHPDMANTAVYGYIDSALPLDDIQTKIDLWGEMGVKGIFMDKFGYDFNVTRDKQRTIIWSIHHTNSGSTNTKLQAFVNGWDADSVFGNAIDPVNNPTGKDTRLNANDWYLAESFTIVNGAYDDADLDNNGIKDWQDKALKLVNYRNLKGTKIAAVTTSDGTFDQAKLDYSYYAAAINSFDSYGWGEQFFSAGDAQLPFRTRPQILGTHFTGALVNNSGILERQTNVGIHINTTNHTTSTLLD